MPFVGCQCTVDSIGMCMESELFYTCADLNLPKMEILTSTSDVFCWTPMVSNVQWFPLACV